MDIIIFTDKRILPSDAELMEALGATYIFWQAIREYVHLKVPGVIDEWNYPGVKYGWNYRIKDKKRAIIYLLPREKYFKVAFVFGEKATAAIMQSCVSGEIKAELAAAKAYAEGRGIRIDVKNENIINDIKELIDIKIAH